MTDSISLSPGAEDVAAPHHLGTTAGNDRGAIQARPGEGIRAGSGGEAAVRYSRRTGRFVLGTLLLVAVVESALPADVPASRPNSVERAGPLFPIVEHDKWGYIDRRGAIAVPARYEALGDAADSVPASWAPETVRRCIALRSSTPVESPLLSVRLNGRWAFVDRSGGIVSSWFDAVGRFREGRAPAKQGDKWGYVDRSGEFVIPPRFDWASHLQGPVAQVKMGGKWGLIDRDGKMLIAPQLDRIEPRSHPDDRYLAFRRGDKWGFLSIDGRIILEARYDKVYRISEGLANVKKSDKKGYIDVATGRFVIEPAFDAAGPFRRGIAKVIVNGRTGYINRSGEYTVEPKLEWSHDFHGSLKRFRDSGKWGLIDSATGDEIEEPRFESLNSMSEGLAAFVIEGKTGYLDTRGAAAIAPRFDAGFRFSEGLAPVAVAGGRRGRVVWGFIDRRGELVIDPRFDEARPFQGGLALVAYDERFHYVDREGRTVHSLTISC